MRLAEVLAWVFIGMFFAGLVAYVGGGLVMSRSRGRGGLSSHPHYRQWQALSGLCRDGLQFCASGGRRRNGAPGGGGVSRRNTGGGGGSGLSDRFDVDKPGGEESSSEGRSSSKKGKKQKKHKKQKKSASGRERAAGGDAVEPPQAAAAVAAPAPAAREWAPTRTGNLSVGARETGTRHQQPVLFCFVFSFCFHFEQLISCPLARSLHITDYLCAAACDHEITGVKVQL